MSQPEDEKVVRIPAATVDRLARMSEDAENARAFVKTSTQAYHRSVARWMEHLEARNRYLQEALDNARASAAASTKAREESHQREVAELRLALLATRLELGRE